MISQEKLNLSLLNRNVFLEHTYSQARFNMKPYPFPQQPEIEVTRKLQDGNDSDRSQENKTKESGTTLEAPEASVPKDYQDNYIVKRKAVEPKKANIPLHTVSSLMSNQKI